MLQACCQSCGSLFTKGSSAKGRQKITAGIQSIKNLNIRQAVSKSRTINEASVTGGQFPIPSRVRARECFKKLIRVIAAKVCSGVFLRPVFF